MDYKKGALQAAIRAIGASVERGGAECMVPMTSEQALHQLKALCAEYRDRSAASHTRACANRARVEFAETATDARNARDFADRATETMFRHSATAEALQLAIDLLETKGD